MGFLDALFGGGSDGPSERKIASTVAILQRRHGEPALRYQAADKLAAWKTGPAIDALLKRFTFNAASETSDEEEKAYVADLIEKIGADAIPSIEKYLRNEAEVGWPLKVLSRLVGPEEFRRRVLAIMEGYDTHFDRNPERKVETLDALVAHASAPEVAEATTRFLEDTDDTVRIAAIELLVASGREVDMDRIVDVLVASTDRPRVIVTACAALAEKGWVVKGRKAEVEPLLPQGYYLTREGGVKRLGK
jgi:hypothetical protein